MRTFLAAIIGIVVIGGLASFKDKPAVSSLAPLPIELRDLMDFLGIHSWKVRVGSEAPFNIVEVSIAWYERPGISSNFNRQALGENHKFQSLQKMREQVVSVMWRNESLVTRFQVNGPGQPATVYTAPIERFKEYMPIGGSGMEVNGEHIIAVKWKKDDHGVYTMVPDKRYMDGYLSVEFQLQLLRGVGD